MKGQRRRWGDRTEGKGRRRDGKGRGVRAGEGTGENVEFHHLLLSNKTTECICMYV